MSADLILHWMLDHVDDGNSIANETERQLKGTASGNPSPAHRLCWQ